MKLMKSWKVVTGQRLSCPIMNTTRLVEEKFCWHEICPKIDSWIFLDVVRIHNFHNSEMKIKTHRFLLPLLFSKTEHSQIHSIQYIQYILTWSSKSMMTGEGGGGWGLDELRCLTKTVEVEGCRSPVHQGLVGAAKSKLRGLQMCASVLLHRMRRGTRSCLWWLLIVARWRAFKTAKHL